MSTVAPSNSNDFIERQLDSRIEALEVETRADVLCFNGPLIYGTDDLMRNAIEEKRVATPAQNKIVVLLTTDGGIIEVVHRIVDTLRRHYEIVEFIVPNCAYSAGTVLVLSGDAIHMDYYSRLGPIDPQVQKKDQSRQVPALGYLEQYKRLIKKAQDGTITRAEVQLLISGFDQAELYQYEQHRELSVALLKEWLCKYKFKNWTQTRTRGLQVTQQMKEDRAAQIAMDLNDTERWHTHGYGISMEVLDKILNVIIDDLRN